MLLFRFSAIVLTVGENESIIDNIYAARWTAKTDDSLCFRTACLVATSAFVVWQRSTWIESLKRVNVMQRL